MIRLAPIAALALCAGTTFAQQDIFWSNPDGGAWSDSENWSPTIVPNNFGNDLFNATLDLQDTPYIVSMDLDVTLQNFSLLWGGATLDLLNAQFTVNENVSVVNGAVVRSVGAVTNQALIAGSLTLAGATLRDAGVISVNGGVNVNGTGTVDIDNTCVNGGGTSSIAGPGGVSLNNGGEFINGMNGALTLDATSSRTITGDGTGSFQNAGTMNNGVASSRGITGVTTFSNVEFVNTGTLNLFAGGVTLFTTNDQTNEGTLENGTWNVFNGSFLNFGDTSIARLATEINISGSDSQVSGLSALFEVTETGRLGILDGKEFIASSTFSNFGEIEVGFGSVFDTGQGLANVDDDGLFGGTYIVAGLFRTGAEIIRFLDADLTLVGPDSAFTGIGGLDEVGSSGRFALESGRTFTTAGNFAVQDGGVVKVGTDSVFEISGILTNNDTSGVFDAAAFEVQGTLIASKLNILEISNELILDGVNSQILDAAGNDAIDSLERIRDDGILRLRNGRSLDISNLIVDGILSIEGAPGGMPGARGDAPGTVSVADTAIFTERSMLEIVINGADESLHGQLFSDRVEVLDGSALSLVVDRDAGLQLGDELKLVVANDMAGEFTTILGLDIGNGLFFEVFQDQSGVIARVVPAPGVGLCLLTAGLAATRRRR